MHEEYQQSCPDCETTLSEGYEYCPSCGTRARPREPFEKADGYIRIELLHPACVLLPCRYDDCDNECWVCGSGSTHDYTVCSDCYDGSVSQVVEKHRNVTVRLGVVKSRRL